MDKIGGLGELSAIALFELGELITGTPNNGVLSVFFSFNVV